MGQNTSSDSSPGLRTEPLALSRQEIVSLVHERFRTSIRAVEAKAITAKTNVTRLDEKNILTSSDLAHLVQLSVHKDEDIASFGSGFGTAIRHIYDSIKFIGSFPYFPNGDNFDSLTIDDLIVSSVFYSGRYRKFLPDYDYFKLLFISLANHSGMVSAASKESEDAPQEIQVYANAPEDVPLVKKVVWTSIPGVKDFDGVDIESYAINGAQLLQLVSLFLILSVIQKNKRAHMQEQLNMLLRQKWGEFEQSALALLGYLDISITRSNIADYAFKFQQLESCLMIKNILVDGFTNLFKNGLLSANVEESEVQEESSDPPVKKASKFRETRLVTYASVSLLSSVLNNLGANIPLSSETLIKLYTGRESGFSIRSLESKIFKWHAPTLFIVSGKRLSQKTITTNRRYQQFDSEYPRFFRSSENTLQDWQNDNDKITCAVLLTAPWKASNKNNFGNEETIIMTLSPQLDYFKSNVNPTLQGKSVYFNTLGMGVGFGNEQPVNRNGTKKFLPGDISLTIEANLEFAVFKHTLSGASHSTFFKRSSRPEIASENFEDRFMITDLEVWGIGSTDVLDEQKKQWEFEKKMAEARQSVNLRNVGEERAFMEMVGLVGNHGSGGSV